VIRSKHFHSLATVVVAGFTVTSAAETLMTLARGLSVDDLGAALEDALLAGQVAIDDLWPIIDRETGAPWAGVMERVVIEHSENAPTPDSSYLEGLLERMLARASLPTMLREFPFSISGAPARVDVYLPDWQLVIEADGRAWHGRMWDQEADRRRDAGLASQGIQVIRLTYRMITEEPDECLAIILAAGSHRSASRVV
jgi:very-short-patch-repair endonuclease